MKLKLSNKTFQSNHLKILQRYINNKNHLHLLGVDYDFYNSVPNTYMLNKFDSIASQINYDEEFQTIVLTDLLETSDDIYSLFQQTKQLLTYDGKLIVTTVNYKYVFIIKFLEFLKLKNKSPKLSHINKRHIINLAQTSGFEFVYSHTKQIIPFHGFGVLAFINKFLEMFFSKFNLGIIQYIVFKNISEKSFVKKRTLIVPAKNEEGNIEILFEELSKLNLYEIIFSVGKSKDNTLQVINECKNKYKDLKVIVHEQSKNGKANSIWEAFNLVTGEVVAILDSDLSVEPRELENFYNIIENNYADFVNGTRLIYPMEKESMRTINFIGNRIFQFIVSFIIGYRLSDSLCGTKVFKTEFIDSVYWWQQEFSLFDPFCDFDLIFTAAIIGEKIVEYPIHYKSRIYGSTQISRFKDGFKLIIYLIKSFVVFNSSKK